MEGVREMSDMPLRDVAGSEDEDAEGGVYGYTILDEAKFQAELERRARIIEREDSTGRDPLRAKDWIFEVIVGLALPLAVLMWVWLT